MAKGDHLTVSFKAYQHHAIDMGDGRVIQYGGGALSMRNNEVAIVDYEFLAAKGQVFILKGLTNFLPDEIVERAQSRIGEKNYSLLGNNCEHFVNWCRTGRAESRQVNRTMLRIASCAAKLSSKSRARLASRKIAATVSKRFAKPPSPLFLLADAVQLSAEIIASNRGASADTSEKIGMASGFSTSVGIGLVTAGPVGAVAGASLWGLGEVAGRALFNKSQQDD